MYMQGLLGIQQFEAAVDMWDRLKARRPKMQAIMRKYDTTSKGYLSEDDLARMLTDMNNGTPPSRKEVVMVCGCGLILFHGALPKTLGRRTSEWDVQAW